MSSNCEEHIPYFAKCGRCLCSFEFWGSQEELRMQGQLMAVTDEI